jgi:hypothetical protein
MIMTVGISYTLDTIIENQALIADSLTNLVNALASVN